jgi:hypothetical protein
MRNEMVKEDDKKDPVVTGLWRTQTSSFGICERQTPVSLIKSRTVGIYLSYHLVLFPNQISNQIKKKSQHYPF